MGPLLAVFPHPDDETFTTGGVMAAAIERGSPVTLVCATRGEAGESAIPDLDGPEHLGAIREAELREAMRHFGVSDIRLLDYRDSGMEGSPEAQHPQALVQAPLAEVAARIAATIREVRPETVVTFGPDGIYGHPDHLHLSQATTLAVLDAADPSQATLPGSPWQTPRLYYATAPREDMLRLLDRPGSPLGSISETARANLGMPKAEITHVVDTSRWADAKLAAFAAHHTQTGDGGPLSQIPPAILDERLGHEYFVRVPLPWSGDVAAPDLVDELSNR